MGCSQITSISSSLDSLVVISCDGSWVHMDLLGGFAAVASQGNVILSGFAGVQRTVRRCLRAS